MKRLLPVDIEETKVLKQQLNVAKNNVERKRITIAILYMWGESMEEVSVSLHVSFWTVSWTMRAYKADKDNFYKTKFKWRKLSKEKEKLTIEVKSIIETSNKNSENLDIQDVRRMINRKYQKEVLTYHQAWELIRKKLHSNYQKPYVKSHKQAENAEEILKERLTQAVVEVWVAEKLVIDGKDIKNKKTKIG